MADPTQAGRDLFKKGLKAIIPSGSPLAQSQDDVLTPEARAKAEAVKEVELSEEPATPEAPVAKNVSQPVQFVSQSAQEQKTSQDPSINMGQGSNTAIQGLRTQGIETAKGEQAKANVYDQAIQTEEAKAVEAQQKADAFQARSNELLSDVEKTRNEVAGFKFEDPSVWKNKSTGQKILFGIGAFLGSLTPQGAQNVTKMINDEINRDVAAQKQEYAQLGVKLEGKQNTYKNFYDKYKDDVVAGLAAKNARLDMVKIHLEKVGANTNSKVILGKTQEAIGKIQMEQEKNTVTMMDKLQKQESSTVPGYKGQIKDPTAARDFKKQVGNLQAAKYEITNLMNINNKGMKAAFSFDDRASAKQSQALLLGQMREILVGPGSMSEGDRSLMEDVIANPASFFNLSSSNKIKLEKLQSALNRKVEANAAAYGLTKDIPLNARELN